MSKKKFTLISLSLTILFLSISAISAADLNDTAADDSFIASSGEDSDVIAVSEDEKLSGGYAKTSSHNTSLEISQTGNYYGEIKLKVSLTNLSENKGIANENVGIYVNNNFWKEFKTDDNGKVEVNFNRLPGTYFIKAEFLGETFDLTTPNFSMGISGISTYLKLKQTGAYYKDTKLTFELTNLANGKGIANEKISVKFSNGKKVTLTTNSKGTVTYNVPFNPGKYSLTAKTQSKYLTPNSVKLNNFPIAKTYLTFKPSKLTTSSASGKYFTVKVTNMFTKNAMSGVKLKLKVFTGKKYKTVSVKTNSKGIAKYDTSKLSLGSHKVLINNANKYMVGYEKASSIKITKVKLSISAPKITASLNNTTTFKITVKNKETKKVLSGVKATIKVWSGKTSKTFTVKTNKNGQATISTDGLKIGIHNVDITAAATSKINKATYKSSITITE